MRRLVLLGLLLKEAASSWSEHRAQKLGAALAFYTTLALAPLTLIAIAIAGYFFGQEAARGGIVDQIQHLVGREGAVAIEALIQKASEPHQSQIATLLSIGLLLFGATSVFAELKDSLDIIWEVKRKPGLGLWTMLKTHLLSFGIVLGTGFLLLVSLLLTAMLTAFTNWLSSAFRYSALPETRYTGRGGGLRVQCGPARYTDGDGQTQTATRVVVHHDGRLAAF